MESKFAQFYTLYKLGLHSISLVVGIFFVRFVREKGFVYHFCYNLHIRDFFFMDLIGVQQLEVRCSSFHVVFGRSNIFDLSELLLLLCNHRLV